jgi:GT2 family glycosyltransferase
MRYVDLSLVTFRPDLELLERLLASLSEQLDGVAADLLIHDNSPDPATADQILALPVLKDGGRFSRVVMQRSKTNIGFGRGHNANTAHGAAPFLFLLNQDCILEPAALVRLLRIAEEDDRRVAAWELRQVPYEHPKGYDPVTLEAPWVSGAAVLLRRKAFDAVGGFEPRIFMYGEDVDLSWRLRAKGWRLSYQPRCAIVHRTYAEPGEVKPLQVFGGVLTNLCLRARFGGLMRTLQGLAMLAAEIFAPQSFPGRRLGLAKAGFTFLLRWPYFAFTRVRANANFKPYFSGWGYELRREGAFFAFASRREQAAGARPLVSILIRTVGRAARLREALASCANQTWPKLEVIVIEDGPPDSEEVVAEFVELLDVRYVATGEKAGRARAGNLALAEAKGEWLNFLDDDDLIFADHVEVLVDTVQRHGKAGAYSLAWEVQAERVAGDGNGDAERYEEVMHLTRHRQPFDRLTLWHHNYLPIQSVLFHRRLYEKHGGFAEDMDQLEDWNLWTRYTLEDDFVLVEKTTSKYRIPADPRVAADRQAALDQAYPAARERQRALSVTLSPRVISEMADTYVRSQAVVMISQTDVRNWIVNHPLLGRLAAWRRPAREFLRRRRSAK